MQSTDFGVKWDVFTKELTTTFQECACRARACAAAAVAVSYRLVSLTPHSNRLQRGPKNSFLADTCRKTLFCSTFVESQYYKSDVGDWKWHFLPVSRVADTAQVWESLWEWRRHRENNVQPNGRDEEGASEVALLLCSGDWQECVVTSLIVNKEWHI